MKGIIIKEINGKVTTQPGSWAFDAEAVFEADGKTLYAHANVYDSFTHLTISDPSVMDYMTDKTDEAVEVMEQYTSLRSAQKSQYYAAIKAANKVIDSLGYFE